MHKQTPRDKLLGVVSPGDRFQGLVTILYCRDKSLQCTFKGTFCTDIQIWPLIHYFLLLFARKDLSHEQYTQSDTGTSPTKSNQFERSFFIIDLYFHFL